MHGAIGKAYGDIKSKEASAALEITRRSLKLWARKKGGGGAAANGAVIVNDDIGRALTLLQDDNRGFFNLFQGDFAAATGIGAFLAVPNTDAKSLSNKLRTIQANISFDKLQAMPRSQPDWWRTRPGQHLRIAEPDGGVRLARAVAV